MSEQSQVVPEGAVKAALRTREAMAGSAFDVPGNAVESFVRAILTAALPYLLAANPAQGASTEATLAAGVDALRLAIIEADGCFEAALAEGWLDALADGNIERIRDLWHRRLSFARNLFPEALAMAAGGAYSKSQAVGAQVGVPDGWRLASGRDAQSGWTIDPAMLLAVNKNVRDDGSNDVDIPDMEQTEAVLLAMVRMGLAAAPKPAAEGAQSTDDDHIGWLLQHDETGRISFCPNDGVNTPYEFSRNNPGYTLVSAAYTRQTAAEGVKPDEAVKYNELLLAISKKHPGESRHETALRYIRQAESSVNGPAQSAKAPR